MAGVSIGGGGTAGAAVAAALAPPAGYTEGIAKLREIQAKMAQIIQKQTALDAQRNENMMIKHELDAVKAGENVYKLLGTILVKQDLSEAKTTVEGRLSLIEQQLAATEKQLAEAQAEMDAQRKALIAMQASYAKKASAAGAAAGGGPAA